MRKHKDSNQIQSKDRFSAGTSGGNDSAVAFIPAELLRYGLHQDLLAAHEALGRVQALLTLQPSSDFILRAAVKREAIHSNCIEGIDCSMQDMLEVDIHSPPVGLPNAAAMAHRYWHALNTGLALVNQGGIPTLNIKLIQGLHRKLMEDSAYGDVPGEFRQVQNWIGGSNVSNAKFIPPPAQNVSGLLSDLERYFQHRLEGVSGQSVVVRMAIAHAQFETIHPFLDGNGRVGRMLMPLILAAERYPPLCLSAALRQHQREYYDRLLDVQQQGKWPEWIRFVAQIVRLSCDDLYSTFGVLLALRQSWEVALAHTKQDSSARRLTGLLIEHPVMSVSKASELLGVSFVAANKAIRELVVQKILEQPKSTRNRVFVANQVIALLN